MWQFMDTFTRLLQQDKQWQTAELRKRANRVAITVLTTFVVQIVLTVAQALPVVQWAVLLLSGRSTVSFLIYYMSLYVLMMGIPVLVGWLLLRRSLLPPIARHTDLSLSFGYVLGGLGLSVAANVFNNYALNILSLFGIVSQESISLQDGSKTAFLLNVLIVGILPALLEELLFRGLVLGALRPAGDRVALVVSALLFSLMHTTLQQLPFTFLLGLVLGYIQLRTGNILLPMAVHFLNNLTSVTLEYVTWNLSDDTTSKAIAIVFTTLALCGLAALMLLLQYRRSACARIGKSARSPLTERERYRIVLLAPLMLVLLLMMLTFTVDSIQIDEESAFWQDAYYEDTDKYEREYDCRIAPFTVLTELPSEAE